MGTRGALGFYIDGQTKVAYNHFDSYPSGLGVHTVEKIREIMQDPERGLPWLREKARAIQVWPKNTPATPELIERLRPYADSGVSTGQLSEVYVLTRKMQGEITAYLDAAFMEDSASFLGDSLFCEYAYIVNLDDGVLEFYRGFQSKPHDKGRYARLPDREMVGDQTYYPVALVGTLPLADLPDNWEAVIFPSDEDDDDDDEKIVVKPPV